MFHDEPKTFWLIFSGGLDAIRPIIISSSKHLDLAKSFSFHEAYTRGDKVFTGDSFGLTISQMVSEKIVADKVYVENLSVQLQGKILKTWVLFIN